MTTSAVLPKRYMGSGFEGPNSPGVSTDSDKIGKMFRDLAEHRLGSATGQARIADPQSELLQLFQDCSQPNWDGEGAVPISAATLQEAQRLLEVIPQTIGVPDLIPEAMGSVAFEWYIAPGRVYVLSLSGRKRLEYAGLLGEGNETHGYWFYGGELPRLAGEHLRELYDH